LGAWRTAQDETTALESSPAAPRRTTVYSLIVGMALSR
jgi:hypothetical protein